MSISEKCINGVSLERGTYLVVIESAAAGTVCY